MLVTRRTFRRPSQSVLKFRLFSSKPDDEKDESSTAGLAPSQKKKAKEGQKKNQKGKQDMDGMNQKQQLDILQQFYDASEAAKMFRPKYSEEELADHHRIGRTFNINSFKRHNRDQKDYATKCWLASEALKSMRADLKANASIIDETPPPPDRPWGVFYTPPIKGFKLKDYMSTEENGNDVSF